jgi:hypothetical protein
MTKCTKYDEPKLSTFKHGVQVPMSVDMARKLDIDNRNTAWEDAVKSEMKDLFDLECFDIKSIGFLPGDDYQKTMLTIIYDVKQDLRQKARLVAGGHLVDPSDHSVYSSTVKGISVKLLHAIAHKADLSQLCGDVSLTFVNAFTNELVYSIAGPKFGKHEGKTVIIRKALYGLCTSAERGWHSHFADTLWSLGFKQARFDSGVWFRLNVNGNAHDYLCTHVDDFMIGAKDAKTCIENVYTIKDIRQPNYYLGNDYKKDRRGRWCIGCKNYLKEAVKRVDGMKSIQVRLRLAIILRWILVNSSTTRGIESTKC